MNDSQDWQTAVRMHLRGVALPAEREAEIVDELAQDLEQRYDELIHEGLDAQSAREKVLAELVHGRRLSANLARVEAAPHARVPDGLNHQPGARGLAIWLWLEGVRQDLRYAVRNLRREPGVTMVALLTLGLSIGFTTSLFAAFNSIMWRPWNVADPMRVVAIVDANYLPDFSLADYSQLSRTTKAFSGIIATRCIEGLNAGCTLTIDDSKVRADFATPNYFQVLGVSIRGSGFVAEGTESAPALVVISHAMWQGRFAGSSDVVGQQIRLDDVPFTVAGVAPAGFYGTGMDRTDVWLPLASMKLLRPDQVFQPDRVVALAGRLAPGVSREQARAEVEAIVRSMRAARPETLRGVRLIESTFFANPRKRSAAYPVFALMVVGVLLIMALACANVGNLLLARAAARRREIAVRLAIGASRGRIVRQLLTESLALAAGSGVIGLAIAAKLPSVVMQALARGPVSFPLDLDVRLVGVTILLVLLTCVGFGMAPALHGSRERISMTLASRNGLTAGRLPLRTILLSVQVGIGVLLLISASLMAQGVLHLTTLDPGIAVDGLSVVTFTLPASTSTQRTYAFAAAILLRHDLAGGRPAAFASSAPFESSDQLWVDARIPGATESEPVIAVGVSNEYFSVLRVPLVAGRLLDLGDDRRSAVVVNETLARMFWPNRNALGQVLTAEGDHQIVGVVKDTRTYYGNIERAMPTLYKPATPQGMPRLIARGMNSRQLDAIKAQARALDPRVRVTVDSLNAARDRLLGGSRTGAALAGTLGVLAVTFAAIGMFSVFAYTVQQRTQEIGIRMALGANSFQVLATVIGESAAPIAIGLCTGGVAAVAAGRLLRSLILASALSIRRLTCLRWRSWL